VIVALGDALAVGTDRVGAKVARLLAVRDLGLPIAEGFVVTADALDAWPDDLSGAIAARSDALGHARLVVRTSALDEDGADASYAGQYESRLDVRSGAAVVDAVRECRAALTGGRVAAYREGQGRAGAARAAIAVQRQIDPWRGGVAFSADPVRGTRDRLVIECAPDTTTATEGTADPERTDLDKTTGRVLRNASALEPGHLDVLRAAVVAIEDGFGFPVDVEWAFETADPASLVILQARPITALPPPPSWPQR
jgi:pyruvate,water dikinase